ncbi:r3H_encore_like protein [Kluyveromyces marxianus]|uniref:R3H_encore_like protein n=1 Tax=Kluyveromyces marxianus TaxID=4911 RepID=A0ABX6F131_KLUMA|nr:r3H_encore_like protein [Kluyveromyces marxianus]
MEELKVTPALLIALFQKPQDRVFLIELENSIIDFVGSSAYTYQLKPMNSYYRLLSHQVAEYHGLQHTVSKDNDKCVIVYKQSDYEPKTNLVLLQQLEPQVMYQFPPEYYALASMAAANNQQQILHKSLRTKSRQSSNHRRSSTSTTPDSSVNGAVTDTNAEDASTGTGKNQPGTTANKKKVKILKRENDSKQEESKQTSKKDNGSGTESGTEETSAVDDSETANNKDVTPIDLEEQRKLKEQQYNEEKEKIFSGSPLSLTPISTPPVTPTKLSTANRLNDMDDDSPQPHQFETSRFRLNNQNEMRYLKKTHQQHHNRKQYSNNNNSNNNNNNNNNNGNGSGNIHNHNNSNNNRYNKGSIRQHHIQPYFGMPPPMGPMGSGAIPYGYPMIAPMEYMYYPMGNPIPNSQMMIPGQPLYTISPPVYQPYEKKSNTKYDSNGYRKNSGKHNNQRTD